MRMFEEGSKKLRYKDDSSKENVSLSNQIGAFLQTRDVRRKME